jgi:hypothetical protein
MVYCVFGIKLGTTMEYREDVKAVNFTPALRTATTDTIGVPDTKAAQ